MDDSDNSVKTAEHWMTLALAEAALAAEEGEVPVGAVVVRDGLVVGQGHNRQIGSHDPSGHAEINALRAAAMNLDNYRLTGCDLYVTIEPCTMCAGALVHARIRHVVYGATEPRSGAVTSTAEVLANPALNHRVAVTGGVMEDACSEIMRAFFRGRR